MSHSESGNQSLKISLHPAVVFAGTAGLGLILQKLVPIRYCFLTFYSSLTISAILFGSAFILGAWSFRTLFRHHQSGEFGKPVTALVRQGPYRYSRNPLYCALLLAYLAFAFMLLNTWFLILFPLFFLIIDRYVIAREEKFLTGRFGAEYLEYRNKVRRWI
jgi:protein-S-isoprenylcysteine O-methyltransferase Ste14